MNIQFNIDKQNIKRTDKEKPVQYSQNFLKAFFIFSEDWNICQHKRVIITVDKNSYCVELQDDNTCVIPSDALKSTGFFISVYGINDCEIKRITTNKLFIPLKESGYTEDFKPINPSTPDIFTDIYNNLHSIQPYTKINKIDEYLYEVYYNTLQYENANNHFKKTATNIPKCCTSFRFNNLFCRNFDWIYNENVDFVVKTSNTTDYYATIGVSTLTPELTKNFVESKQYSDSYKLIPFYVVDVLNEKGLYINSNVVPTDKGKLVKTIPTEEKRHSISIRMIPRFCADHFSCVDDCIDYLTKYVEIYPTKSLHDDGYELHWMIGDKTKTIIMEIIENEIVIIDVSNKPIMSNFYIKDVVFNQDGSIYTPKTQDEEHNAMVTNNITLYGAGLERYNTINENIQSLNNKDDARNLLTNVYYTNTYDVDKEWYTEFVHIHGLNVTSAPERFTSTMEYMKNIFEHRSRDPDSEYYGTWQTIHSCIYDIDQQKLYIVCQEGETEYVFDLETTIRSKITETIDENSTHFEIPTAKAVWDLYQSINEG